MVSVNVNWALCSLHYSNAHEGVIENMKKKNAVENKKDI
jgi:hypothetical protein